MPPRRSKHGCHRSPFMVDVHHLCKVKRIGTSTHPLRRSARSEALEPTRIRCHRHSDLHSLRKTRWSSHYSSSIYTGNSSPTSKLLVAVSCILTSSVSRGRANHGYQRFWGAAASFTPANVRSAYRFLRESFPNTHNWQAIYAIGASMNSIANIKNVDMPDVAVLEWEG